MDELDELVICKWCGKTATWGSMIWLNGRCMCPTCYIKERAREDSAKCKS